MATEIENELLDMCKELALTITYPPEDWHGEHEMLDIEYTVDSNGTLLGARMLMTFGGPNIYINTRTGEVEGYWGTDKASAQFIDNVGLDDFTVELHHLLTDIGLR
jgi:hypothetical protein